MKFNIEISEALTSHFQPAVTTFGNVRLFRRAGWRAGLLSGVAAGALCVAVVPAVAGPDACIVVANVATCSGNQSGGIDAGADFLVPPVDTLVIENLTADIGINPSGGDGVRWAIPDSAVNIISNTGDFVIRGEFSGFNLFNSAGKSITLDHTGNIQAERTGIHAEANRENGNAGSISIKATGRIDADTGISASSIVLEGNGDAGAVSVTFNGIIAAPDGGINAESVVREGDGNSGPVTIDSKGSITSIEALSHVAGNGNSGNISIVQQGTLTRDGIRGESYTLNGNAGHVVIENTGDIQARDYGIRAISKAEAAAGNAGNIDIATKGNIQAGTAAIYASSLGGASEGDINILVEGELRGLIHGVMIEGGVTNSLKIVQGSLVQAGGTGFAIHGTTGDETVDNAGTVIGNVNLGQGINRFNNLASGVYQSGDMINLDTTGHFHNAGVFIVGGLSAAPVSATLTGSLVQDASGVLVVDVAGGTADRLNVSGSADLAGKVVARFGGMTAATQQYTIVSADGGLTNNGITGPASTVVMNYELLFPTPNDMVLSVTANYVTAGLTPNQKATAQHLQGSLVAGGGLGAVLGYLGSFADVPSYAKALDRLHPEPYLAQTQSVLLSSLAFADGVLTCSDRQGTGTVKLGDDGCGWARIGTSRTTRGRTLENIGFGNDAWSASGGAQFSLAPNWLGTVAFGYERYSTSVDDRARSSGDLFQFGAGAMYRNRGLELSGIASAGIGSFDTTRFAVLPGVNANGDNSASYVSGRLRAAYAFGTDAAYVKPMVDFDLTALRRGGFAETGAGSAGLRVHSQTDGVFSLAPAVEVGGQFVIGQDVVLRPFVRGGVRFFTESDLSATASFIGSPAGAVPFTVSMPLDQTVGEISSGLELLHARGIRMGISYEGRYGSSIQRQMGAFTLRADF